MRRATLVVAAALLGAGCSAAPAAPAPPTTPPMPPPRVSTRPAFLTLPVPTQAAAVDGARAAASGRHKGKRKYPWHHDVVSTTFWVGEIFNAGPNGSQVISAYDDHWMTHYGGCDGVVVRGACRTERRTAANGYFPLHMTPKQNPFYLDVPFDDVNDRHAAAGRMRAVPWAHYRRYRSAAADPDRSLMKDHWVKIRRGNHVCYGQVEDAGPGQYHDARYVFGTYRPRNRKYNGAGMDVSPALTGCLHFSDINGDADRVSWRFVNSRAVPAGPWTRIVTR